MKKFEYASIAKKMEGFGATMSQASYVRRNFPMVSLENSNALKDNEMHIVRDWCETQFGDRWIYDWNDFYFHTQEDANWFALRWS